MRIDRIAHIAEICKDEDGELNNIRAIRRHSGEDDYYTKTEELSDRGSSTRSLLYIAEAELVVSGEKERKEDVHTLVRNEEKHFLLYILELFRQECQRSRSSYRYKEIEEGELSNSL